MPQLFGRKHVFWSKDRFQKGYFCVKKFSAHPIANNITAKEKATKCSLRIAWILEKHKKSFSDAEMIRECMIQMAKTLFDG